MMKQLLCGCGGDRFSRAGTNFMVEPSMDGWKCAECGKITFIEVQKPPQLYGVLVPEDARVIVYVAETELPQGG
jgi:hypothetical protein